MPGISADHAVPVLVSNTALTIAPAPPDYVRDGDWMYIVSVRAGRQTGPMMLFRVPWNRMFDQGAYVYWNGSGWGTKEGAVLIFTGRLRQTLAQKAVRWHLGVRLAYTEYTGGSKIVTRTAASPEGPWSEPKVQRCRRAV